MPYSRLQNLTCSSPKRITLTVPTLTPATRARHTAQTARMSTVNGAVAVKRSELWHCPAARIDMREFAAVSVSYPGPQEVEVSCAMWFDHLARRSLIITIDSFAADTQRAGYRSSSMGY